MGNPFHVSNWDLTANMASIVPESRVIQLSQGLRLLFDSSDTSVAANTAKVANLVSPKIDFPNAGSKDINFPSTLAMTLTLCLGNRRNLERIFLILFNLFSETLTVKRAVSMVKPKYSFLWLELPLASDFSAAIMSPADLKVSNVSP
jgi:hypothetical protein